MGLLAVPYLPIEHTVNVLVCSDPSVPKSGTIASDQDAFYRAFYSGDRT